MAGHIVGGAIICLLTVAAIFRRGTLGSFVDIPTLRTVVFMSLAGLVACHGLRAPSRLLNAAFGVELPGKGRPRRLAWTARRYAWGGGAVTSLISATQIAVRWPDSVTWLDLSIVVLGVFYAASIDLAVLTPLATRLQAAAER